MARCQDGAGIHERLDRSFDLLGNAYRRRVIYALRRDNSATVDDLADAVVAAEIADDRERALASLIHVHLPKLADFDVVDYGNTGDSVTPDDSVTLADGVERLEPFLGAAARLETDRDRIPMFDPSPDVVAGTGPD